jgi:1-acyl-sn-glycerol-3-phosphate acyltransferase
MLNQVLRSQPRSPLQTLARWILGLFGWKAVGHKPPYDKFILIAAHHTSNWDLPLGLLVMAALGVRVQWIGKDSIFRPPFGKLFRKMGGIPVNRRARNNFTQQMVDLYAQSAELAVVISPEGTRSKTEYWRTGFYYIASGAQVPIVMAFLDYATRTGGIGPTLHPSGDIAADMERIRQYYDGVIGRFPEAHGRIELRPTETPPGETRE